MLERGYRYAFVSNSDNLGAVLDPRDPRVDGRARRRRSSWRSPTARRPTARAATSRARAGRRAAAARDRPDARGGPRRVPGHRAPPLLQHQHDLVRPRALAAVLERARRRARAAADRNRKTVDPSDGESPAVFQIETAMGAAIGVFEGARALRVPRTASRRSRRPNDLLALRSDAYVVDERRPRRARAERGGAPPVVDLDSDHFKLVADFEPRFPAGAPSLRDCDAAGGPRRRHVRRRRRRRAATSRSRRTAARLHLAGRRALRLSARQPCASRRRS